MQHPEGIAQLILAFLAGTLTEAQTTDLTNWRKESAENEALFQKLTDMDNFWNTYQEATEAKERIWERISGTVRAQNTVQYKPGGLPTKLFLPLNALEGLTPVARSRKR